MNYNMTALQNSQYISDLVVYADQSTNGLIMGLGLIALFVVLLTTFLRRNDFDQSLLVSSFLCFIASLLLNVGGYVVWLFPSIFLLIMALTGFVMFVIKR